jgi:hypothetical protein
MVTALFDARETVEDALRRLDDEGVPRDLVDVVVAREAADRFYRGIARRPRREVFKYGGIGGLVGLSLSALVSLGIVAMPGFAPPGVIAVVQLLGPNIGTVAGAALGALFGTFHRQRLDRRFARAAEQASAILLAVRTQSSGDAATLERIIAGAGGRYVTSDETSGP